MSIIYFFISTSDCIFTVHDDIVTYMQAQRGEFISAALAEAKHGRICHIPMTFLLQLPYIADNKIILKIFSAAAVIFDISALYIFIKNITDKISAYLCCQLLISFACVSNQHNLFVSYIFGHQIPIGILIFSLNFFVKYYSEKKTSHLVSSSLLFFTALLLYEATAAYIILFIVISMYKQNGNTFKNLSGILYDTHYHILFLLLFTAVYFAWRSVYPSDYDGAVIYTENMPISLAAILIYSSGMTPGLPLVALISKNYVSSDEIYDNIYFSTLIFPLITAIIFFILLPKIKNIKNSGILSLFCVSAMITPNITISFTKKYVSWIQQHSYSYLTSFYSYFFMIPLILLIVKKISSNHTSKFFRIFSAVTVFCISLSCTINNTAWNIYYNKNLTKYEVFRTALSSEFFNDISNETTVYIPDYKGIHNSMEITEDFARIYTSSNIKFENDESLLDFSKPVICMRYDENYKTMLIGYIDSDFFCQNVYVCDTDCPFKPGSLNLKDYNKTS